MKNLLLRITLPLSIVALLATGIVTGCDKQEKITDLKQTVQKAQNAEGVTAEADYEAVFKSTTAMLDKSTHLTITKVEGGYAFTVSSGTVSASRIAVCSDTSASLGFTKCCRAYVLVHSCIEVTVSSSGNWNGFPCGGA